jgi:hypothetical protein
MATTYATTQARDWKPSGSSCSRSPESFDIWQDTITGDYGVRLSLAWGVSSDVIPVGTFQAAYERGEYFMHALWAWHVTQRRAAVSAMGIAYVA